METVEDKRKEMRRLLNSFQGNGFNDSKKIEELNREIFRIQKEMYEIKASMA